MAYKYSCFTFPKWRGAAPVQRAIENNDKKLYAIMKMNDKIDEGPILAQLDIEIKNSTDGKQLTIKLVMILLIVV